MDDIKNKLFDDLCSGLSEIEARFFENVPQPPDEDDDKPDLQGVKPDIEGDENDQTGDVSGQIAALNDRFRQNQSAEDDEIKGEWIMGDDVNALPVPTKAAIKRRIAEYADFEVVPLHDRGSFDYESKGKTYPVIWMIKVYDDASKTIEASNSADPQASYRTMLVTISDVTG